MEQYQGHRGGSLISKLLATIGAGFILIMLSTLLFGLLLRGGKGMGGGNVGLVKLEGVIRDSEKTVDSLYELRDNDSAKAILLRIDSPGGGIAPSQEIFAAVRDVAKKKPVVVSMGSVAASGGYYAAAGANRIVANPSSLTGSIGVIMEHYVVGDIAKKLMLRWEIIKAGEVKDMGSPLRDFSPKERALLTELSKTLHEQFIRDIAEGRKMTADEVRLLATGEVFSGEQALKLKLVDELGSQRTALEAAAKLANLKDKPKLIKEDESRGFGDIIIERLMKRAGDSRVAREIVDALSLQRPMLPMAVMRHLPGAE